MLSHATGIEQGCWQSVCQTITLVQWPKGARDVHSLFCPGTSKGPL